MAILSEESKIGSQNLEWVKYKLMNDASTDETTSDEVDVRNAKAVTLAVEANTGVSAGVVKLEGAVRSGYAGTWIEMGSLTINAASKLFTVTIDAGDANGLPLMYIRARIETAISGGNIDVYVIVQK